MSLDALRETLPAYAKDLSLNLSSLANETLLTDLQDGVAAGDGASRIDDPDPVGSGIVIGNAGQGQVRSCARRGSPCSP